MNEIKSDKPQGEWLLLMLVVAAFLFGLHDIVDHDVWWHLKAGEWIRANGTVPEVDPFSMHPEPGEWIDLHWGMQVVQSFLVDHCGIWSLTLLEASLAAATCLILIGAAGDRHVAVRSGWVILLTLIIVSVRWRNRPETISMLLMAATLVSIDRVDRMVPHRFRWFLLAGLLPLVWVNCHSLFVLGLCAGGAFAAGTLLQTLLGKTDDESPVRRQRLCLALLLPVCQFAAALCNPYFLRGTLFPIELWNRVSGSEADFSNVILEFRPTLSLVAQAFEVQVFLVVCLVGIWSFVKSRHQPRFWRWIVCLGFGYLAFKANRNTVWLTIAICTFYAHNLRDLATSISTETRKPLSDRWRIPVTAVATGLVIFGVASSWWYEFAWGQTKRTGFGIWMDGVPTNATDVLKRQPGDVRLFAFNIKYAAWFMWKADGKIRSFMDPRLEVHDQVYQDCLRLQRDFHDQTDAVLAEIRQRGCTHIMLPIQRKALRLLLDRSDVQLLSIDGQGMIFSLTADSTTTIKPRVPSARPVGDPPELKPVDRLLVLIDRRNTRVSTHLKDAAVLIDILKAHAEAMPILLAAAEKTPASLAVWGMLSRTMLADSKARQAQGSWLAELRLAQAEYALSRHSLMSVVLGRSSTSTEQKLLPSINRQLHPAVKLACRLQYQEAERQLRDALNSGLLAEPAHGPAKELLTLIKSDRGITPRVETADRQQVRQ